MTVLACIADDFTGATDLASLIARSGVKVCLRMGTPQHPPTAGDTAPVEIIALKCRSTPPDEARAEVAGALDWLQQTGAKKFFWKYCSTFDSTDKGNIGVIAEFLMQKLGTEQTIYCPSFPENGRSVYQGHLFVGDELLSDSPMKDHPLNPMQHSNLQTVLKPQMSGKTGLVNHQCVTGGVAVIKQKLSELKSNGVGHVVVDAIANDDLTTIAEACYDMILITGGSAIAMPLPHVYQQHGLLSGDAMSKDTPSVGQGKIVLSGSCSAMTRKQVAQYEKQATCYKLDPLSVHKNGIDEARAWLKKQDINADKLIYATAEPAEVEQAQQQLGVEQSGRVLEDALAILAKDSLEMGIRRFVVAGGETSGAVTKALGVTQLTIGDEIAPGVPWTFCHSHGHEIALALKSGNFGDEKFFAHALDVLGNS